jgi:aminopeptidase N
MSARHFLAAALLVAAAAPALAGPRVLSHRIEVKLDPATSRIEAVDTMTVARDGGGDLVLDLNSGLQVVKVDLDGGQSARWTRPDAGGQWTTKVHVDVPAQPGDRAQIEFRYEGVIADQVKKSEDLSFVVGDDTRGVICSEGAYLPGGAGWYPSTDDMTRFEVKASVPAPYLVVTQGTRDADSGWWRGKYDADRLDLVAAKWRHEERKIAGGVTVGTYLGEDDAPHAKLLLDAAEGYLKKYGALLGPYPYDRFDVVENWFTTGFGMPEFTLLGKDVIGARMIPESQRTGSIPSGYLDHEIVHSWWGNSVFPDFRSGNWCEGITSYCANYMSQEWLGDDKAREHRRRTVLRFTLGATPERDYPVRKFFTKTEDVDNDVGYGKCSMFFHALRRDLGDQAFWETLRRVAREYRGKRFAWADWQREFEKTSERNLAEVFAQALDRRGAPLLAVRETSVTAEGGRLRVTGTIVQVLGEGEAAWRVAVPVVVEHLEGREECVVDCAAAETRFSVLVPSLPLRVTVDPDFHVFRRFAADEVPSCLAATLGRPTKVMVYPDDDEPMKAAARLAAARCDGKSVAASQAPAEPAKGTSYLVFGDVKRVPLLASLAGRLPRHFPSSRAKETTRARDVAQPRRPGGVHHDVRRPAARRRQARARRLPLPVRRPRRLRRLDPDGARRGPDDEPRDADAVAGSPGGVVAGDGARARQQAGVAGDERAARRRARGEESPRADRGAVHVGGSAGGRAAILVRGEDAARSGVELDREGVGGSQSDAARG